MQIKIEEIKTLKTGQGKYGLWELKLINGKYSYFVGDWNGNWDVGQVIDVQVKTEEKNGKTYHNIVKPDKPRLNNTDEFTAIHAKLDKIIQLLGDTVEYDADNSSPF